MTNNRLNFLDTTVCLENKDVSLEFYRKSSASNYLSNYKHAVSPKSYKIVLYAEKIVLYAEKSTVLTTAHHPKQS